MLDISRSDVGCKTVANMIKGKTPEEIRKLFNIVNDFTPEEEVGAPFSLLCIYWSIFPDFAMVFRLRSRRKTCVVMVLSLCSQCKDTDWTCAFTGMG